KPENIMLQPVVGNPAHVRILDFGLAKAVEKRSDTDWMLGSPTYMAPEQVNRESLGTWSDLYGLGVIFYELVTGRKPFPGDTDAEIVGRKLDEEFDPVELVDEEVLDDGVLEVMKRALANRPEDRFETVEEFRPAIERAFDTMEGDSSAVGPGSADLTMLVDEEDGLEVDDERVTPTGLVDVGGTIRSLAAGKYNTCALLDNDEPPLSVSAVPAR
ncbi:MAG: serine/threonine protein kinase, partial [Bradymonadaceae bacterium]